MEMRYELLLLDEHTAALDPGSEEKILEITRNIVASEKITCMMITHNMQSAIDLGNRLIMMNNGQIICDFQNKEKESLTVSDLVSRFQQNTGSQINYDEMLLQR